MGFSVNFDRLPSNPSLGFPVRRRGEEVVLKPKLDKNAKASEIALAVANNDHQAIKLLASKMGEKELTAMLFFASALRTTDARTIHMLVDFGANVKARDSYGRTFLHEAAAFGNAETSIELVKVGVELDAVSRDGSTAAVEAGRLGHYEVVSVLESMHANMGIKNRYGRGADSYLEDLRRR